MTIPTSLPIVIVEWDDAQGSATKAFTIGEVPHQAIVMHTLGWLVKDDMKGVSIATEAYLEDGLTYYRGHTFVPRGMVRQITPYKLTKAKGAA